MTKKILFVAHLISHINHFHIPYIKYFKEKGYTVHVLTNASGKKIQECDKLYDINIRRSPFSVANLKVINQCKQIINNEKYDIVYCHTPMGGVIGRLASLDLHKKGCKVIYMAHGFHFFKGAPIQNWLIYYNIEKHLAKYTDAIITINDEDYNLAKNKFTENCKNIYKINGIGVNRNKFYKISAAEKIKLKNKFGYNDKFVLIYGAEFTKRKNQIFFINALKKLKYLCPDIKIVFAGDGELFEQIKSNFIKEKLIDYTDFLGYCNNMPELYRASDITISSSKHEGLAINVIEALCSGLPAVVSDVRGNKDLIINNKNGFTFSLDNIDDFCNKINMLYSDKDLYNKLSENAKIYSQQYSINESINLLDSIFNEILK